MQWSAFKLALFDKLLTWLAGQLWEIAQDAVSLWVERAELTGPEKLALARTILLDRARELGRTLTTSAANFLLEAALQAVRGETAKP